MTIGSELARLAERVREAGDATRLARTLRFDRPVLVFGSAPAPVLPRGWPLDAPLVTVNGSQASAVTLGLPEPTLTVLSITTLGRLESNREAQRVLRGRRTRHLLVVSHPDEWARDAPKLAELDYAGAHLYRITTRRRSRVIREQTGSDAGRGDAETVKVSNGVFAICQALALGAPQVVVAGFSLSTGGHAYNGLGHKRLHVGPDARAFAALAARGAPVFAADDALAAELGLPAWRAA